MSLWLTPQSKWLKQQDFKKEVDVDLFIPDDQMKDEKYFLSDGDRGYGTPYKRPGARSWDTQSTTPGIDTDVLPISTGQNNPL